jgi:hypothetical protein
MGVAMATSRSDEMKNQAYLVYSEWGPNRAIPRDVRLAECFSDLSEAELSLWKAEFREIDRATGEFAESGGPRLHSYESFKNHMHAAFPFMNEETMLWAWSLCGYYTVHDGF